MSTTLLKSKNNNFKYTAAEATSDATGVSNSLVKLIAAEGKQATAQNTLQFSTPTSKNSTRRNKIQIDNFTRVAYIRRSIH